MVKVEIVDEKDVGTSPYVSTEGSRTSSSASLSSASSDTGEESLFDRVAALIDIIPPAARHSISSRISKTTRVVRKGGKVLGNIVWVVTTSVLLVALPLALALEDEAKIMAHDREIYNQQQGAEQMLSGSSDDDGQDGDGNV